MFGLSFAIYFVYVSYFEKYLVRLDGKRISCIEELI